MNTPVKEKGFYAPWQLKGDGYIALYKLPYIFLKNNSFISEYFMDKFFGGLSALMIIDYQDSDVGPYQELLFIPGLFNFAGKKYFSISKIYVNSQASLYNGYENWAIPKEYADFKISHFGNFKELIEMENHQPFFKAELENHFLKLPFSTKFLPLSLIQYKNNQTFITDFFASGFFSKARIKINFIDADFFPCLDKFQPLVSFKIHNFDLTFKEAKVFDY